MQAIWQMVDAMIIPIMTYSCEGWDIKKKEKNKLQTIFNEALKTILYLPKRTKNNPPQWNRKDPHKLYNKEKTDPPSQKNRRDEGESLIKDATKTNQSLWRKKIDETIDELHLKKVMPIISKNSLKRLIQDEINSLIMEEIDNETEHKTKVKHWRERKINLKIGIRPDYMNKLTRKQRNAIIKTRASMLSVKTNHKNQMSQT